MRDYECVFWFLAVSSGDLKQAFALVRDFNYSPLLVQAIDRFFDLTRSEPFYDLAQLRVSLPHNLAKLRCLHSMPLKLLERAAGFDCLMLFYVSNQEHFVLRLKA